MTILATFNTFILLFWILFITGCSTSVYMPKELCKIPRNELARVGGTGGFKEVRRILAIDGVETPDGDDVYVTPGKHEVLYSYKTHTRQYGAWTTRQRKILTTNAYTITTTTHKGYRLIPHNEAGKCKLTFDAGQEYDVLKLNSMLENAGCRLNVLP